MVHVFYYLNGLDGTVGDLMALPRSQNSVMERGAFSALWQDFELPGSLTFGSQIPLPPGSAVIVHSALMHGRRAMPGEEKGEGASRAVALRGRRQKGAPSGWRVCGQRTHSLPRYK